MATIKKVKRELRHQEWAEEIAECQSSGMKIREWCRMKGISCNTYYRRLRAVRTELLEKTEQTMQQICINGRYAADLVLQFAKCFSSHVSRLRIG